VAGTRLASVRRTLAAGLLAALAGTLLVASPAAAGIVTPESGGSPNADDIATLYKLILAIAIVVFIGVEGLLIYTIVKYRARRGAVAAQIHGNTRLEIGWTVGAAVILVLITLVTFYKLGDITDPAASDIDANGNPVASAAIFATTDQPSPPQGSASMTIRVSGQQYVWRFQYPGEQEVFSYEEMVVPRGMTVILRLTADDVAHSWWIPALGGKQDALPGYVNKTWFKAVKNGVFTGQCAELCGRNHANMTARVRVVDFAAYRQWYDRQAAAIEDAQRQQAAQRRRLEASEAAGASEQQ
jgi:cytochrome c oxidase subunit 2